MASSSGEDPHSSPTAANAPAVAMDAKLMVSTGRGDCEQLNGLVMASGNQASTAERPLAVIHPLVLASACRGYWKGLNFLLNREDAQAQQSMMPTQAFLDMLSLYNSSNGSLAMHRASGDVEDVAGLPAQSAASLLEGVTVEGDTALHMVAANGDDDAFLTSAKVIYSKAEHLLFAQNKKGDTPLHCAARAGKYRMVSHLIGLARGQDSSVNRVKELLETELHEAVRIGNNDIVELLMEEDSELASFPKDGTSHLYLAILMEKEIIAEKLYNMSYGELSYSGPNGQNALHAAVLRGTEAIKKILEWNKRLTIQMDQSGSTPLHFAASVAGSGIKKPATFCYLIHDCHDPTKILLEANPHSAYQPDNRGKYPIHVAASTGNRSALAMLLRKCPECTGLRDAQGRSFLHVAVEQKRYRIVQFVCRDERFASVLNMQDCDGNTALHLAVQGGIQRIFCCLMRNQRNRPLMMFVSLRLAGAHNGIHRQDLFHEQYISYREIGEKKLKGMSESTQVLGIGLVLIATVTFAAAFTLPGGYKADDHTNGGTPTLARSYAFNAFIISNTLAFICSMLGTFSLVYSGTGLSDFATRWRYFHVSAVSLWISVRCLAIAFALGVYVVLAPVVQRTAISVCVISSAALIFGNEDIWQLIICARTLRARLGIWKFGAVLMVIPWRMVRTLWPYMVIFGLPLVLKIH